MSVAWSRCGAGEERARGEGGRRGQRLEWSQRLEGAADELKTRADSATLLLRSDLDALTAKLHHLPAPPRSSCPRHGLDIVVTVRLLESPLPSPSLSFLTAWSR